MLIFFLFMLMLSPAMAAQYYVDPANGNDSNAGTLAAPWLTIHHASLTMVAGDTMHALPGTYGGANQSFSCTTTSFSGTSYACITTSGTVGNPITYVSDTKWGAKLVCNQNETFFPFEASYIIIDGFDITCPGTSPGSYGYAGGQYGNNGHNIWRNNYIHDMGLTACGQSGLMFVDNGVNSQGFNTYDSNVLHHWGNNDASFNKCITSEGIYDGSPHETVTNNVISGGTGLGIHSYGGGVCNDYIANNTVFDMSGGGILLENTSAGGSHPVDICANSYTAANNTVVNNIALNNGFAQDINSVPYNGQIAAIHLYGDRVTNTNIIQNNLAFGNNLNATDTSGSQIVAQSPQVVGPNLQVNPNLVNYQSDKAWSPAPNYNFINYKQAAGSPAIDSGTTVVAAGSGASPTTHDIFGFPRPCGTAYDMGAFEF